MIAAVDDLGLRAPYVMTSTDDEWERYEGLWAKNLEIAAREEDDTELAAEMRARARKGRANYWRYGGRDTLGFAVLSVTA
jgi:hypothetical protein